MIRLKVPLMHHTCKRNYVHSKNYTNPGRSFSTGQQQLQGAHQRYTYRELQTIQMKLKLLYVWAEPAVLDSAKTALKFKYEL